MTDIVERLRDREGRWLSRYCKPHSLRELRDEAADEIERLRAENAKLLAATIRSFRVRLHDALRKIMD
jgi:hypothetical protein